MEEDVKSNKEKLELLADELKLDNPYIFEDENWIYMDLEEKVEIELAIKIRDLFPDKDISICPFFGEEGFRFRISKGE